MTDRGRSQTMSEWVPSVDVSALDPEAEPATRAACVAELGRVCREIGFFFAVGHGVKEETLRGVVEASRMFFGRPKAEKRAIDNTLSYAFRGYIGQGIENTGGVPDEREQIEFGSEGEELSAITDVNPYYLRLQGPNQWPNESTCPNFRARVEKFVEEMDVLSRRLTSAFAEVLGLPPNFWDHLFTEPHMQMKICRYPGLSSDSQSASSLSGVGAHSDSGFLTLLLQDDVGGLQVQTSAGEWVDVNPIPNTLVVNLGEILQLASGGQLKATVHRVERRDRERISVPYFWNPRLDATVTDLASEEASKSSTHGGGNVIHAAYGANAFKSLARSHPGGSTTLRAETQNRGQMPQNMIPSLGWYCLCTPNPVLI